MNADLAWLLGVFAGVVVGAAVVNQLAPVHRPRLRRALVLFALAVLTYAVSLLLTGLNSDAWAGRLMIASEIFRLFVIINTAAMVVVLVLLPRVGLALPVIAGELLAGVGYVVATLGVFARHDIDLSGALATGAVVSAVLAISLQTTLGNILGGVALQLDGSIHEGDWIQLENGKQGKVRAIRWRHTLVETRDWATIVVPNAQLLANNITLLGMRDGKKTPARMWVYFNVDFRYPPSRVTEVVMDAVLGSPIENVAADPAPNCVCMDFAKDTRDSFAYYALRYWLIDLASDDGTNSRVRARIYAALHRAEIPLAVPAQLQILEMHDEAHHARHAKREAEAHLAAIKTVGLLRSLDDGELRTLADGLIHAPFVAGEIITRQGATAHYLYIMTSGRAEIRTKVDPDGDGPAPTLTRTVATISAPDFFGEMGLVTGEPRSADVVAASDVECYRLGKATFERVLLARPEIAVELSHKLATRRVELIAAREGLDAVARKAREESERAKILGGIKTFFGL